MCTSQLVCLIGCRCSSPLQAAQTWCSICLSAYFAVLDNDAANCWIGVCIAQPLPGQPQSMLHVLAVLVQCTSCLRVSCVHGKAAVSLNFSDRGSRAPYLLPVRTVASAAVACTFRSVLQSDAGVGCCQRSQKAVNSTIEVSSVEREECRLHEEAEVPRLTAWLLLVATPQAN